MIKFDSPKPFSSSQLETASGAGLGSLSNASFSTIIISTMMSTMMMRSIMMMGMGTTITG